MSELFDSLERGLKQAVAHANNTKKARTKKNRHYRVAKIYSS